MILVADFGGTTIKLGIVHEGAIVAKSRMEAQADHPMSERLEAVACAWEKLLEKAGCSLQSCQGSALALPFLVDPKNGRVLGDFGKFPGAAAIDYDAWSHKRLGLPIALENDLRVALLGEWKAGSARGKADVLMLALGTGIGCAVVSDGRMLRGAQNRAATLLGHSTIDHDGSSGRCGSVGCAEDFASTATLELIARKHPDFATSALAKAERIDFETLFAAAADGDGCSIELLRKSLKVWAVVVQNAVLAYDPEIVVLGGGVLRSSVVVIPAIEQHLRLHMPAKPFAISIVPAELGDGGALLGGEILFKEAHPNLFL